jgi:hypothetical protein
MKSSGKTHNLEEIDGKQMREISKDRKNLVVGHS